MLILLVFSFLAGIFTVLSPCILPVLPAILSGGTIKGRLRPLGIILGLVVSFTFFTLFLTAIVHATGLSANYLRYIAIAIIFFFGVVMIFPSLSDWFARISSPVANFGQQFQGSTSSSGFGGGFFFGIALGLLWTPCAGPILAAITTLVATQSINFTTILITISYSLGAGIPMFLIAYGGNKIISSSKTLTKHSEGIRQFFGFLMILTAIAIAAHWDMKIQTQIARYFPPILIENNSLVKQELEKLRGENFWHDTSNMADVKSDELSYFGPAPEIVGIVNWINSPPLSLMQLRGKVVLVDFWTYSCINCLRTLPYITKWYESYKDKGLVVIGVHTPEFEFEKDPKNVAEAATRLNVTYPVAQDNDYKTWSAYHNQYWPAHYLIDQKGIVREVHFGEGEYVKTENDIRQLLGLPILQMEEPTRLTRLISPETYLGSNRGYSYTDEIQIKPNEVYDYSYDKPLTNNLVGLKGKWKVEPEYITAEGDGSTLDYNFLATNVYLVMTGFSDTPLKVFLDGKPSGEVKIDGDRKYDIVMKTSYERHLLSLKVPKGVSAYAFTFGDE